MDVEVVSGDITEAPVDAIANAANVHLWMGAGVAGAIKHAGGDEIEREAVAKGPLALGDAVATGAGRLPVRWIVHGAVVGHDLSSDAETIRRATRRCLEVADELGAESLALPALGTGVGGVALAECAGAMVDVITAYEPESLGRILIVVRSDDALDAFKGALAR